MGWRGEWRKVNLCCRLEVNARARKIARLLLIDDVITSRCTSQVLAVIHEPVSQSASQRTVNFVNGGILLAAI